ncbi:hypothetical protein D3C81_1198100 [compost metagenome]
MASTTRLTAAIFATASGSAGSTCASTRSWMPASRSTGSWHSRKAATRSTTTTSRFSRSPPGRGNRTATRTCAPATMPAVCAGISTSAPNTACTCRATCSTGSVCASGGPARVRWHSARSCGRCGIPRRATSKPSARIWPAAASCRPRVRPHRWPWPASSCSRPPPASTVQPGPWRTAAA